MLLGHRIAAPQSPQLRAGSTVDGHAANPEQPCRLPDLRRSRQFGAQGQDLQGGESQAGVASLAGRAHKSLSNHRLSAGQECIQSGTTFF
jgi:hypothetical protein